MTNRSPHQRTRHKTERSDPRETAETVDKLFSVVQNASLYQRWSQGTDTEASEQFIEPVIDVSGYTLRPCDGRFPLFSIALTVYQCHNTWSSTQVDMSEDSVQIAPRFVGDLETPNQRKQVCAPEAR